MLSRFSGVDHPGRELRTFSQVCGSVQDDKSRRRVQKHHVPEGALMAVKQIKDGLCISGDICSLNRRERVRCKLGCCGIDHELADARACLSYPPDAAAE